MPAVLDHNVSRSQPSLFWTAQMVLPWPFGRGQLGGRRGSGGRIWGREQGCALLTEICSLPSLAEESRGDSWLLQPIFSWKKSHHT